MSGDEGEQLMSLLSEIANEQKDELKAALYDLHEIQSEMDKAYTNLVEYARNDVYVIFKLDSNKITNLTGQYHITNQDGEYISSGKYTVS